MYEYSQNIWQLFVDFKKAYNSVHWKSLYNHHGWIWDPKETDRIKQYIYGKYPISSRVENTMPEPYDEVKTDI